MKRRKIAGIPSTEGCISGTRSLALGSKMVEALTAWQARGARAMLDLSIHQLAEKSKVSGSSIRRIETGFDVPEKVSLDLRARLQTYFESRGFVFTRNDGVLGVSWRRGKTDRRLGVDRRQG